MIHFSRYLFPLFLLTCSTWLTGQVIINEVNSDNSIELVNAGSDTVNISQYWLCDRPTYERVGTLDALCGGFMLAPGDTMVVQSVTIDLVGSGGELAIYDSNSFGDTASIQDYLIWGSKEGSTRESVAVGAGIWIDGERIDTFSVGQSILYDGEGESASDYSIGMSSICGNMMMSTDSCDVNAGTITTTDSLTKITICVGDSISDAFGVILTGNIGESSGWIVSDTTGIIIDLPLAPPFDFENVEPGICLVRHVSFSGTLNGASMGASIDSIQGCYELSNAIRVDRLSGDDCPQEPVCEVSGGVISLADGSDMVSICTVDDQIELIEVTLDSAVGTNSAWVLTDTTANILAIDTTNVFDLDSRGIGVTLIWHLSFEDTLQGAAVGNNAADLMGCFSLSNPIRVTGLGEGEGCMPFEEPMDSCNVSGGVISLADGSDMISICTVDDQIELIEVTLDSAVGTNSAWVLTDTTANILAIEASNTFDLDARGVGVTLIWHLSFEDTLQGAAVGNNASDLMGCFSLSNPIRVTGLGEGEGCMPFEEPMDGCMADGGILQIEGGGTEISVCAGDGASDAFNVEIDSVSGTNTAWIIADEDGNILAFPFSPPFDFEGAGAGVALVYHIAYEDGISGVSLGGTIEGLEGCFDLSNPITVTRAVVEGGDLSLATGGDAIALCDDGSSFTPFDVIIENAVGTNAGWVLTDADLEILALPLASPFDLEGTGSGTNLLWHISFEDGLEGAEVGANAGDLIGCFDLSNPITITRNGVNGGDISIDGATEITVCVGDSIPDPFNVTVDGADGQNLAFVVTDTLGTILEISDTSAFDFEGAGVGVCLVWHLAFTDGLEGAVVDSNANDLMGCFNLSNPITVNRVSGEECPQPCEVEGGMLMIVGGDTTLEICADDGEADTFVVEVDSASGPLMTLIITAEDGEVLALPDTNVINLEGSGPGICSIWNISYEEGARIPQVGDNVSSAIGCLSLSNPVTITRLGGDDCPMPCDAEGGTISTDDDLVVCADDEDADVISLDINGSVGESSSIVITDADANILAITNGNSVDLNGTGSGTTLIWHLSSFGQLTGAEVGANAGDIEGCFDLSNALTANLLIGEECDDLGCGADGGRLTSIDGEVELEFCSGATAFTVAQDNDAEPGLLYYYVVTDDEDIITEWRLSAEGADFEYNRLGARVIHIYGWSTDGSIPIEEGMPINSLEGDCGDLSDGFLNVTIISGGVCDEGCHAPRDVRISKAGNNRYRVRWDKVAEAESYVMEIGFQGEPNSFAVVPVRKNKVFVSGPSNKVLVLRIQAVCANGELSPFTEDFLIEVPKRRRSGKNLLESQEIVVTEAELSEETPLYPNPAFDQINVYYDGFGEEGVADIFSQDGRRVLQARLSGDRTDHGIDISTLQEGMYFLRITAGGEAISQKRFIKAFGR